MLFINFIFLFLFSFIPIHLVGMDANSKGSSVQQSRDTSPVAGAIRIENDTLSYYIEYDYPGCRDVRMVSISPSSSPKSSARLSIEHRNSSPEKSKSESLSSTPNTQVLSASTDRLNYFKDQLNAASESTLKVLVDLIKEKLIIAPVHSEQ